MNERIRELIKQMDQAGLPYGNNAMTVTDTDLEYFAELIVRECSKVIVNGGYRNPALGEKHSLTPPEIAQMIKEHFGVEE